ncbi:MAG: hypothetical protein AAGH82_02230 [Pseudomonadota bacterium]
MSDFVPFLLPAAIAAIVALVVAYFASRGAEARLRDRYERELSPQKLARQVLLAKRTKCLPFASLKAHFGGLSDDQLRRALLGAGALRFKAADGTEEWGLIARNKSRLAKPESLVEVSSAPVETIGETAVDRAQDIEPKQEYADDWSIDEAEDELDRIETKPIVVTKEVPKPVRRKSGIASRGREVGVSLRRAKPVEKTDKGDRLIGELDS